VAFGLPPFAFVCFDGKVRPSHVPRKAFSIAGLLAGLAGVAAVTALFSQAIVANSSTVGFSFLMVVLAVATFGGFRVAASVAVAATFCFNFFFLPPVGRLTVADPENWAALLAFLVTALVASRLSDKAQREAAEAKLRQRETEQLYALSRAILLTDPSRAIGTQAAQSIAQIFEWPCVLIFDAKSQQTFRGGTRECGDWGAKLADTIRNGVHHRDGALDLDIWPISLGGSPMGALAAVGSGASSDGAVHSMLNLVAIALERVRTEEAANRAEAARQSEEFKSTLLDAIAHEFKTPLTSIKAAATGLRMIDAEASPEHQELTTIIDEESDRLSQLVTEAVKMAEVDAGKVRLRRDETTAGALLDAARAVFDGRGAERIEKRDSEGWDVRLIADRDLMSLALRQVLDNALKYSSATAAAVRCECGVEGGFVTVRIADQGPGIPERDQERIFDKFYRRANTRDQVPGTGLGLHIAREIARIHGGDLFLESGIAPQQSTGATFCFRIPKDRK
jgi:two-component system sensor histidine kinase KdpD